MCGWTRWSPGVRKYLLGDDTGAHAEGAPATRNTLVPERRWLKFHSLLLQRNVNSGRAVSGHGAQASVLSVLTLEHTQVHRSR